MAISQVPPLSSNVPIVYPPGHPSAGCPTPAFATLMQILLEEKAVTDALAEGAIQPGTVTTSGLTAAAQRILGNKEATTGAIEELTLSQALDLIGSAAQGDLLYRGATAWKRLPAGTSGQYLKTLGAGADLAWAAVSGGGGGSSSYCQAYNDGTQSIPSGTSTAVTFNSETFDTNSIHSTASNTSRFTIPTAGKWVFSYGVRIAGTGGSRFAFLRKNNDGTDASNVKGSGSARAGAALVSCERTITVDCAVGDYIELFIYQDSGSARTIGDTATGGNVSFVECWYLGS